MNQRHGAILDRLAQNGQATVQELAAEFDIDPGYLAAATSGVAPPNRALFLPPWKMIRS